MKIFTLLIIPVILSLNLFAESGKALANKLGLSASSKAIVQWDRLFKKKKKLAHYGLDKLTDDELNALKTYLISHAADSDAPEAAGL